MTDTTREITTPIELAHNNLVPGTEIVTVKGSPIPRLIRDSDYIMDYTNGILRFLSDGAGVTLSSLIEQNGIDVQYSYRINFKDPSLFESQVEVFTEVATRISSFTFAVKNSPVNDVSRVFNLTTQELYTPVSLNGNQITFSGVNAPRTQTIAGAATTLLSSTYNPTRDLHVNTFSINYPSSYTPNLNPIVSIGSVDSRSTFLRILVIGGQDFLTNTVTAFVPLEAVNIQLVTGARTIRKSNIVLQLNTDYTFTLQPTMGVIDYNQLTISLTSSAIQKIRTNSLYCRLIFSEIFTLNSGTATFNTTTHHVNETVNFSSGNQQPLTRLYSQADLGDITDVLVLPNIVVFNPDTGTVYQPSIDYNISSTQKTITRVPNGTIGNHLIQVAYLEQRTLTSQFTLVSDVVLIDYVWGNNSINWDALRKEVPTTEIQNLEKNQQFITLKSTPLDVSQLLIYFESDPTKSPVTTVVSFNSAANRLQVQPLPATNTYVISYTAISEPIPKGTVYYASYKYGAVRQVLGNRFARLMSLDNTTTFRQETFAMLAGQTTVQLARSPTDLNTITIFDEGDPQQVPVATATNFDTTTGILTFTPVSTAGLKVIRYQTTGFDSNNLRKVIQALFDNFSVGPTQTGFENIIAAFVDTPAQILSGLQSRFVLPNASHTVGNQIQVRPFETSPPLSSGQSSVNFVPARFNLGALFETTRGSYVRCPTASNISIMEGTLEFLMGAVFNPSDNQLHYFFDIMGDDPTRNRFSLYKSKTNFLNFDILDSDGNLYRTSLDVEQIYFTEIINLTAGATTAILSHDATPAKIDLNNDKTPDLYEGLFTKFIIMPATKTFPSTYKKASIKVLGYDPPTRTITFEAVPFSGQYIFSYVSGLAKYEETENFVAVTWKLHTLDGEAPFYRLYINGVRVVNQTLADIVTAINSQAASGGSSTAVAQSSYDTSRYDTDVYEP